MALQHLRSSTASKRPDPAAMADGQLAINTAATSTGLFYKNASGALVKAGPVHIGATAPNATPASGGHAGHSLGESWLDTAGSNPVLKIWDGSAWQIAQPVASGTVVSTADTGSVTSTMIADGTIVNADVNSAAAIAGTKVSPSFGDQDIVTTGNLTLNAQGDLRFGDSDSSNWVAFQAPATVTANVTWTLPAADGTTGQVLSTNGSGTLSWATAGGGATDKIEEGNTSAEVIDTGSDGRFVVTTEGSERLRVGPDGQIGLSGTNYGTSGQVITSNGTAAAPTWQAVSGGSKIEQGNTSAEVTDSGSNGTFVVTTEGTERARVDSSGRMLVGTNTARGVGTGYNFPLQNEVASNPAGLSAVTNSNDGESSYLVLGKSRGTSVGANTVLVSGDTVGRIVFAGADGTDLQSRAAEISAWVDGTPGANDMPGRIVLSTTSSGSSSPTKRLEIQSNGNITFSNVLSSIVPATDNAVTFGANGFRWSAIFAANGTIQTSDERTKADIADAQLGTDFIKALRPVSYKWIEGGKRDTGERDESNNYIYESVPGTRTHWGFIAQEVKQAVDAAGVDFGGWVLTDKDDPDSQQALRYDQFIAPLTKALQEAMERIETLEAEVAALKAS